MRWLIYGAYGYTGELVARLATARGMRPVLAGRRREPLTALAGELDLPCEVVDLTDPDALREVLAEVDVVAHCAGPYADTAKPMVAACLETGTHYLDMTGELDVFEWVFGQDAAARAAGIVLLPGAGFDVVPTDCLAARLAAQLPDANTLELAFVSRGGISGGTYRTGLRQAASGPVRRVDGVLVPTPLGQPTREVPFPSGVRPVGATRWADLVTAFRSTGIPNITVYTHFAARAGLLVRVLRMPAARWLADQGALPGGPDAQVRARTRCEVWAEVRNAAGRIASVALVGPNPYDLTADAGVRIAGYLAAGVGPAGPIEPGAHTPATALGADFVTELDRVVVNEVVVSDG